MYETEVVLGLMASASALYGFYLAYYTFARSLQFEERVRIYDSSQAGWLGAHESNEGVAQIESRREKLGYFFVGASASFLVSVFSGLLWLAYPLACLIPLDEISFGGLALLVIPLSYYAGKNLKEARVGDRNRVRALDLAVAGSQRRGHRQAHGHTVIAVREDPRTSQATPTCDEKVIILNRDRHAHQS